MNKSLHLNMKLTFAGLHALRPLVIHVLIVGTAAFLEPGTTRSTTTRSAGFLENAAPWACRRANWSGDWYPGYKLSLSYRPMKMGVH